MIHDKIVELDGVEESPSAFKDAPAYWVNSKEIAHLESDHTLDIRVTKAKIRELRADLRTDPRITLRRSGADWLTASFASEADEDFVLGLVRLAVEAHQAPPGTISLPPPNDGDLARRRRFH